MFNVKVLHPFSHSITNTKDGLKVNVRISPNSPALDNGTTSTDVFNAIDPFARLFASPIRTYANAGAVSARLEAFERFEQGDTFAWSPAEVYTPALVSMGVL